MKFSPGKASKATNILAIGSHPDDIEFGCAGTISRFTVDSKTRVYLLVMTPGSAGGDAVIRQKEQMRSAEALGVKDVFWGSFEDTKLPLYHNVIQEIEKVVKKIKPSFVFVHHGKDTHQDHRHVHTSTVAATRNVPNVLFYEGPTSFDFEPDVFVNINDVIAKKEKILSYHKSQVMRTNIAKRSIIDIATATATFRGTQCRVDYAEGFQALRMFLL